MILRRRWEYWVCAVALCKLGATIIPASLQLTKKDKMCIRDRAYTVLTRSPSFSSFSAKWPKPVSYTHLGGERQRIGLARVFLHDAPFVLLDEPTSNLDSLNEAAVLRALSEGRGDKTVVLVSHRASTAAIADVEYTVDRGRLG